MCLRPAVRPRPRSSRLRLRRSAGSPMLSFTPAWPWPGPHLARPRGSVPALSAPVWPHVRPRGPSRKQAHVKLSGRGRFAEPWAELGRPPGKGAETQVVTAPKPGGAQGGGTPEPDRRLILGEGHGLLCPPNKEEATLGSQWTVCSLPWSVHPEAEGAGSPGGVSPTDQHPRTRAGSRGGGTAGRCMLRGLFLAGGEAGALGQREWARGLYSSCGLGLTPPQPAPSSLHWGKPPDLLLGWRRRGM